MSQDEVDALADVFSILLADIRKNFVVSKPWLDDDGQAHVALTRRDDEPQRDEATKTLNQDHHKGSPNGQSDRIEAR